MTDSLPHDEMPDEDPAHDPVPEEQLALPELSAPVVAAPADESPAAESSAGESVMTDSNATESPVTESPNAESSPTGSSPTESSAAEAEAAENEAAEAAAGRRGKGEPLIPPDEDSLRLAEAMIFASASPVTPRALTQILPDNMDAAAVLSALRGRFEGRGVELVEVGGGVQFRTAADLAPRLRKVVEVPRRLPRVAMETLAIVAYHQPVTRPEIEEIRGASLSQQTLDSLLEAGLVAPKGRKEAPGRPTLWATTPAFLAQFGLKDLRELPRREDLLVEPVGPRDTTARPQEEAAGANGETPTPDAPIPDGPIQVESGPVVSGPEATAPRAPTPEALAPDAPVPDEQA